MRTRAIGVGCTTFGLMLAMLGAPLAQADDDSFIATLRTLGFTQGPNVLVRDGESVCYALLRNNPPAAVASRLKRYTASTSDQANQLVALAVTEYCPQYLDRLDP